MKVNAEMFLSDFQTIFIESRTGAERYYFSNRGYTSFIIREINRIIASYGLKNQNEYFRIDAIGWSAKADLIESTKGVHLSRHLWDLEVAVEHENDPHDWMDEVIKLAHIVCPLRVVIGYLPWELRQNDGSFDMLNLDHISKELKKLQYYENMEKGEFLVILGNCYTDGNPNRYFGYKGYVYDKKTKGFSLLSDRINN